MNSDGALPDGSFAATRSSAAQLAVAKDPTPASYLFDQHVVATLPAPWSMVFLPDGRLLVTERPAPGTQLNPVAPGHIRVVTQGGQVSAPIVGLPANVGVLDVVLDPHFAQNHLVYFSYLDRDPAAPRVGRDAADTQVDPVGLAVARGVIDVDAAGGPALTSASVIWHQFPDIVSYPGSGEPGGRLLFSPDGTYLFIAAGDRQEFSPVQALDNTLGKTVRIYPDGTIPADNPFVGVPGARPEIWDLGHRNVYGMVFDRDGTLWQNEMGPMGGDELNIIRPGANYGWPNVSYGNFYDGTPITKPAPGDGFAASALWWTPVIAPGGMIDYSGSAFSQWRDDFIIPGLQSIGLVVVHPDGTSATEVQRIDLGTRTRNVTQGPDGSLWVLTDQPDGRLLKLDPHSQIGYDGDFDGDGRSDLLWRSDGGQLGSWSGTASGAFAVNDGSGALVSVPTDWHLVGRGDFTGDGRDDLLWRSDGGLVGTWTAKAAGGFTINDGAALRQVPADWIVVGTGDFNGDGRSDILWRNVDGRTGDWLGSAGGGFLINEAAIRPSSTASHVVATGDFDGDGRADILWRSDNGGLGTWFGRPDGGFSDSGATGLPPVSTEWLIVGSGDFNGDGRSDLLWRNVNGTVGDWLATAAGGFAVNQATIQAVPTTWHVASIGDYNGDGRDDLLWRNDNGAVTNWLGTSAGTFVSNDGVLLVSVESSWRVQDNLHFF